MEECTKDEHARVPEMQIVSVHTWEKISEEEKERFRTAAEPVYQKYCSEYMDIIDRIRNL